jgi:23S rRNA (uracil1939-C5)-methyltransferase
MRGRHRTAGPSWRRHRRRAPTGAGGLCRAHAARGGHRGRDRGRPDRDAAHRDTVAGAGQRALSSHYRSCGGCALMHASDGFVAGWKVGVIETALRAQGLKAPMRPSRPPRPGRGGARRWRDGGRRRARWWASTRGGRIRSCRSRNATCWTPGLLAVVPVLQEIARIGGSRAGVLSFAMTLTDSGVDLRVSGGKPLDGPMRAALGAFAGSFVRLTWEDEPIFAAMPPWCGSGRPRSRRRPGRSCRRRRRGRRRSCRPCGRRVNGATRIADLFAGCGPSPCRLRSRASVHAVEGDAACCKR